MMGKPKIRFKGYNEDWEQRKLNEVAEFNPKSDLPESFEYVDLESVVGTEMVSHRTETKETAPSRAQRLAQTGDVFFQTVRPYQRNNYLFTKPDNNYVFSTGYAHMRPKIDAEFLMCFLQTDSFVKVVLDNCTGTSYPAINSNDLSNLEIYLPTSEDEQRRIGCFITNLDYLITLHQHKCDEMKKMKKCMLQKMFPQNGKKVPEIRFEGFTNDWEQRKLGEIATYRNGKAHEANQLDVGTYELVNLNSISIDGGLKPSGKFIEDGGDTLQRNDLVMVLSDVGHGDLLGRVAIIPENNRYVLNQRVALLRINDDTNTYFLFSIINRYQDYFKKLGAGSSQLNISRGIVENFEVTYPNVAEQRMIADYFHSLDHLITLHQHKCDELQNLKKYMLQNMFV